MSMHEIAEAIMDLPEGERLELARRIVAGALIDPTSASQIEQAVQGIEDVLTGKVQGLSEAEFREALK